LAVLQSAKTETLATTSASERSSWIGEDTQLGHIHTARSLLRVNGGCALQELLRPRERQSRRSLWIGVHLLAP